MRDRGSIDKEKGRILWILPFLSWSLETEVVLPGHYWPEVLLADVAPPADFGVDRYPVIWFLFTSNTTIS